jgi:hypothetical protein
MTKILRNIFYTMIFLSLCPVSHAEWCSSMVSSFRGATPVPMKTEAGGGPNSFDSLLIGVTVKQCIFFRIYTYNLTLKPGEFKSQTGSPSVYKYFAQISVDKKVCDNKCVYGNACPAGLKKPQSPLSQCTGGLASNCDPAVTSSVINTCGKKIGKKEKDLATGICVYKSRYTGYEMVVRKMWNFFLDFIKELPKAKVAFYPALALKNVIEYGTWAAAPNQFDLLTCFPVPMAPLPPPFCIQSMTHYPSVSVLRICTPGEQPIRTTLGDQQECVMPSPRFPNVNNTFMTPCVRVTYNEFSRNFPPPNTDSKYSRYYTINGDEILYTQDDVIPENTLIRYADIYNDQTGQTVSNSSRPLKPQGFNGAKYVDICGKVDPKTGEILTYTPQTIVDDLNNSRRFELDICTDPITGSNICTTPFDRFSKMNICVKEIRNNGERVMHDCVNRPDMEKPKVSFCDGTFNDKTNSCMKTEVASVGTYEFKGPMTECTDTQGENSQNQLCTLQTANPFGFQAILTNRLYVNRITTTAQNHNCTLNKLPYSNTSRGGCDNCHIDELGICDKKVVGAERLCLIGYADVYNSLAKGWCQDDPSNPKKVCNRVCARATPNGDTLLSVNARTNPVDDAPTPLTTYCPYSGPEPEFPYRVRNPIEDDLCVDAYTIEFNKDCRSKEEVDANFPTAVCNSVKSYCSELKSDSTNQYKNFDQCQRVFKECLNSKDSADDDQRRLDDGTVYTCAQIKQFVSR